MKKLLFLIFQLLGYITVALVLGRYLDAYFSLRGKAVLICVILVYILWFLQLFKMYR